MNKKIDEDRKIYSIDQEKILIKKEKDHLNKINKLNKVIDDLKLKHDNEINKNKKEHFISIREMKQKYESEMEISLRNGKLNESSTITKEKKELERRLKQKIELTEKKLLKD
jgi:uncharacterized protein involved in exopolysaccharide biosynthesis